MKASVTTCKHHGIDKWRVRWIEAGKVRRKFYLSKDSAEAYATQLRGEALEISQFWAALSEAEREQIVLVWREAQRRKIDLLSLVTHSTDAPKTKSPAVQVVITELLAAKTNARRAKEYVQSLKQILTNFSARRERLPMDRIQFSDVESFIEGYRVEYRSTLRSRLSTFFKFAVRRGYCLSNLCERLESVKVDRPPPRILTVAETLKLLKWFKVNPRALAWFVLSTFAGLRPDEARKTLWKEINFDEKWIRVEKQTTKVNERRVVYPRAEAMAWLKRAKRLKSELPLTDKQLTNERREFRQAAGFKTWPQDVTRHSAASYWLAVESAEKVAAMLGHSERILHSRYKALVTKVEARAFWASLNKI